MAAKIIYLISCPKDAEARDSFLMFMRPLVDSKQVCIWHDGLGLPGEWSHERWRTHLASAHAVVVLVSAALLASDEPWQKRLPEIVAAQKTHAVLLVPILVSHCLWQVSPEIVPSALLPQGQFPLNDAPDPAQVWSEVCQELAQRLGISGLVPRHSAAASDGRSRLRRLSEIARSDAVIVDGGSGPDNQIYRLDQNLYVQRKAEASVRSRLVRVTAELQQLVLVVGEAGCGKTSLLWRLYEDLRPMPSWEVWFLKSTVLARALRNEKGGVDAQLLERAIASARRQGSQPLLLLDTVDLLLHDERSRDYLLELLLTVQVAGASVVATCRPSEARVLALSHVERVGLHDYDEDELAEAIDKHVARCYRYAQLHEREEHRERISNLVARGRSLGKLCTNPLTLRLIFMVYAPHEVPPEVNVFGLYERIWQHRVVNDIRQGVNTLATAGRDLSRAVHVLALLMLADGTPSLTPRAAERALAQLLPDGAAALQQLVNRGVVQGCDSVEFFHQTFFEHAAARALLSRMRRPAPEGLAELVAELHRRPADLFLLPVLEQTLLLAEMDLEVRSSANSALVSFLASLDPIVRSSAVYVYVLLTQAAPALDAAARDAFASPSPSVANQLFTVAPSIADKRLPALFKLLDVVWFGGEWRIHENLLVLFEQLAPSAPQLVCAFLQRHEVSQHVVAQRSNIPAVTRLRNLLRALSTFVPQFVWGELAFLYIHTLDSQRNREQQAAIVEVLLTHGSAFGVTDIGARFEAAVGKIEIDHDQSRDEKCLTTTWGRLFACGWQEASLAELLAEIQRTPHSVPLKARLNGLAALLVQRTAEDARATWAAFLNEPEVSRRWLFCSIVWAALLALAPTTPALAAVHAELGARLAGLCIKMPPRTEQDKMLLNQLCSAVSEAEPLALAVLDLPTFREPARWLDPDQLAPALPRALQAGHPAAQDAMALFIAEPESHSAEMKDLAMTALARAAPHHPELFDDIHHLAVDLENAVRLVRLLDSIESPWPENLLRHVPAFVALRDRLIASPAAKKRRTGVQLWVLLLRRRLLATPSVEEIMDHMENTGDAPARAMLAAVLGHAAASAPEPARATGIQRLAELAHSDDPNLRARAYDAFGETICETKEASRYLDLAYDAALAAPADAGRIAHFGFVLEQLVPAEAERAADMAMRVLCSKQAASLGSAGRRKIRAHWRMLLRRLVQATSERTAQKMLHQAPQLDAILGQLVIETVCIEAPAVARDGVHDVLSPKRVPDDVRLLVPRYRHLHEQPDGVTHWADALTFLPKAGS